MSAPFVAPHGLPLSVAIPSAKYAAGEKEEFLVVSTYAGGVTEEIWRAYHEFELLQSKIATVAAGFALPARFRGGWVAPDKAEVLEFHRTVLGDYLNSLLKNEAVSGSEAFINFLLSVMRFDWPHSGPIDLVTHDLPHETSATEWWYYNMHFIGEDGNQYSSYFVIFRRIIGVDEATGERNYIYASHFAIVDVAAERYEEDSLIDRRSAPSLKHMLSAYRDLDPILREAFGNVLDKGVIPLPDRMPKEDPVCDMTRLHITIGDSLLQRLPDGTYSISAIDGKGLNGLNVIIHPRKPAVRHGTNGIVKGHQGDDMFYYCVTRCELTGSIKVRGKDIAVRSGQAWYDHEFGGTMQGDLSEFFRYGWNWASIQLNNGWELSAYYIYDRFDNNKVIDRPCMIVDPAGRWSQVPDIVFEPTADSPTWQSSRTFCDYPLHYKLDCESYGAHLKLEAVFGDQELLTTITCPAYWEGRVVVSGVFQGVEVSGIGFVERNGFSRISKLNDFFRAVGKRVRQAVKDKYPDTLDEAKATRLFCTPSSARYLEGVPLDVAKKQLIDPIRLITDRGGKSWRSYATLACVDVVGGDSREIMDFLSAAEFLHVGSLVIDDIQDESATRRGGITCHQKYGLATAINAGSSAYFSVYYAIAGLNVTPEVRNRVYEQYFLTMRAGHLGQALDINGLDAVMDECVATDNAALAQSRVIATHKLKTAAPAGCLARIGVMMGHGTDVQVESIGNYFESVGIAFQIMDDVLNLRGIITTSADKKAGQLLKDLGEDIRAGKVTYPVVKGIGRVPHDEMVALWAKIKSKPEAQEEINACIAVLEKYGAIQACVDEAMEMVEEAWRVLDPTVPDSFYKIMLRAFGWFVVERST